MIWIPGVGEVPMSLSVIDGKGGCGFTVKPLGETTRSLCAIKVGDKIGIRGPYGNCFTINKGSSLVVGGGTGLGPLIPLSRYLVKAGGSITFVLAGRNKDELLFMRDIEKSLNNSKHRLFIVTDDGSLGTKGLASDCVSEILIRENFDMIYTCGPELMMKKIFLLAEKFNIKLQASLERYMKCGFGICGSCSIGEFLVCKDGPVFKSEQIRLFPKEFGISRRDPSGRKIPI
jgi:dihydroorotate dehydrogenase electron transfer subunit